MKVPAQNLQEGAKCVFVRMCACVCQRWVCEELWGVFVVEQVHKIYMYANVHKELKSVITLERLHSHTHTLSYVHTNTHTHT